jgi:nucleotide-binding universal stress UspA family protein
MYRSILVPLDGSSLGEQALPFAQDLAQRTGAALHLAHVHIPPTTPMYTADLPLFDTRLDEQISAQENAYLDALAAKIRSTTDIQVESVLLEGAITDGVADLLASCAAEQQVDIVVMTTHGRGGLARLWLGSVADELLRRLPMPVLLLRPYDSAHAPVGWPPRQILIPLDGSANAEAILPYALALGQATQAEYTLLRVIEPVVVSHHLPVNPAVRALDEHWLDQRRVEAQAYLEQVAARLAAQSLKVHIQVLVEPQAALAILEEAHKEQIGLLAMATHGRHGLARLLVGSVADKVLRGATIPLLLYRPPE